MSIFLSICIPTYNRASFLIKNLTILQDIIKKIDNGPLCIEVIVSNNCSSDDTHVAVNDFINENKANYIRYFRQEKNLGLEKNALFVLGEASGEYIIFLGDDDYLEYGYLGKAIDHLKRNEGVSAIIPDFVPISVDGRILGPSRDRGNTNRKYKKGFLSCLMNSQKGHQLSGLILRRKGLLEKYHANKVNNIYLFIYFVSIACLEGDVYHLVECPVRVMQPAQVKKDWGYGQDGLFNHIFDNYIKLEISALKITLLQLYIVIKQEWRMTIYLKKGLGAFFSVLVNIWFCKNSTSLFRIVYPFFILLISPIVIYKKIRNFFLRRYYKKRHPAAVQS